MSEPKNAVVVAPVVAPRMLTVRASIASYTPAAVTLVGEFLATPYDTHDSVIYQGGKGLSWEKLVVAVVTADKGLAGYVDRAAEIKGVAAGLLRSSFPNRPASAKGGGWDAAVAGKRLFVLATIDYAAAFVAGCMVRPVATVGSMIEG